jgi:glutamate N-acetyltransferase/amino-acid N-acetyltransferase
MNGGPSFQKIDQASITAVRGFKAAGISCGIKKESKDLALVYSDTTAVAAGVFTRNLVQAAPVLLCRERIDNPIRGIVINSGNANACTGEEGMRNAVEMAALAARRLDVPPEQVLICSTGVIGAQLPMDKVRAGINTAARALSSEPQAGLAAAEAIITTDYGPKQVAYRGYLPAGSFFLAGMAKGAGMICPDMATMLAFLFTDVNISRSLLKRIFREAADRTFNLISVDGDTSTNDTALILANGAALGVEITGGAPSEELFAEMVYRACRDLACQIVLDGEGATKLITLTIQGAPDATAARTLARSVLNSLLVKTAFFGEDANWGRILAALGYAGIAFDPAGVDIFLGPVQVAAAGQAVPFREAEVKAVLQRREIPVLVDLHAGDGTVTALGSDLSHAYVSLNSNYRS